MFAAHTMPYTIQPNPMVGRIELAGVFLLKDALLAEKIKFGKLYDSKLLLFLFQYDG